MVVFMGEDLHLFRDVRFGDTDGYFRRFSISRIPVQYLRAEAAFVLNSDH